MKSLLSEAEKKEIRDKAIADITEKVTADVTRKVTEDVTRKVTADVTVKNSAVHVLNLMETLHLSYEEAVFAMKIPAELQEAVRKEVKRFRNDL